MTSQIVEGGGQVITTTVLESDVVASIGESGVKIVTVTATPAPAVPLPSAAFPEAEVPAIPVDKPVVEQPQPVTSIITMTIDRPAQPNGGQVSTATITIQQPTQEAEVQQPQTKIITMTVPAPPVAPGVQECPAPVTVTETRIETVSICESQLATDAITVTVSASESISLDQLEPSAVSESISLDQLAPSAASESISLDQPAPSATPEALAGKGKGKGGKHQFRSYFDSRRRRLARAANRP